MKNSNREKFRYYFENTFASGPIGVIRWLAIMSFITILLLGCVIVLFGIRAEPDATDPLSFLEGAWQSLMATLDSGTMGGDEGWAFRIVLGARQHTPVLYLKRNRKGSPCRCNI